MKEELEQLDRNEREEVFRIETLWEKRGRAEGKAEARREFASRLLEQGMSVEDIAKLTDLTIEAVNSLRSNASS